MYIPDPFRESKRDRLDSFIEEYPFGMLVTIDGKRPFSTHLPFLVEDEGLVCHLARANPQCAHLGSGDEVLCVFQGPHAYVSPAWYKSPGVPTWNYAVVHVYGVPTIVEDTAELASIVGRLSARFEAGQDTPWQPHYDERLLSSILGMRIHVTDIQGKFKLSQNRTAEDRRSVIARLEAVDRDLESGVAALMRKNERLV